MKEGIGQERALDQACCKTLPSPYILNSSFFSIWSHCWCSFPSIRLWCCCIAVSSPAFFIVPFCLLLIFMVCCATLTFSSSLPWKLIIDSRLTDYHDCLQLLNPVGARVDAFHQDWWLKQTCVSRPLPVALALAWQPHNGFFKTSRLTWLIQCAVHCSIRHASLLYMILHILWKILHKWHINTLETELQYDDLLPANLVHAPRAAV